MTPLQQLDPRDPIQDKAANDQHDRKYGWRVTFPREYTNIARNPEYQPACPQSWLANCKDEQAANLKIWEWHNRKPDAILQLEQPTEQKRYEENRQSTCLLFSR